MGLFHDDFYSTKVSRWGRGGWNRSRRERRRTAWIATLAAIAGAAVVVLVMSLFRSSGHPLATPVLSEDQQVVQAADRVRDAVVSVISTFQDPGQDKPKGYGLGSGVIFEKSGAKAHIVTNDHVVAGGSAFEVVLADGTKRTAHIVGEDAPTDLAVIEVDGSGIKTTAEFGDSDKLRRGQTAIAIGSPLGFSQTITKGIISAPKQTISNEANLEVEVIQTDAAINQGNSGGALINLDGQVIGINSMKIAETGVEGLGFAIPINNAKPILESLIKDHKVKRPYMGITPSDLQDYTAGTDVLKLPENVKAGVIVLDVVGPAKDAGLKPQDVIVELDGKEITSSGDLRKYLYNDKKIGDKLTVTFYRASKKMTVTLTLGELPSP